MIKVFIPQDKRQGKTDIKGFWYSKDNHKIYYDYLKIVNTSYIEQKQLEQLKKKYNQEAIAFIDTQGNHLRIYYNRDKIEFLPYRIYSEIEPGNLRTEIKEALKVYGGVTIYKKNGKYFKEIFYK